MMKIKIKRKDIVACLDYNGFSFLARLVESKKIKNIDRDFLDAFTKNCKMKLAKQLSVANGNFYTMPQQKFVTLNSLHDKSECGVEDRDAHAKISLLNQLIEIKQQ